MFLNKFKILFSFLLFISFIVEDEAGGGEIDDIDINEADDADEAGDAAGDNDGATLTLLEQEVAELRANLQARDDRDSLASTFKNLGDKHKGFDSSKVKDYLTNLHKTDPDRAAALNNPIGFENIWLNEFKENSVENDSVAYGRNITPVDRSEEVLEKINNGEALSLQDELSYYGSDL